MASPQDQAYAEPSPIQASPMANTGILRAIGQWLAQLLTPASAEAIVLPQDEASTDLVSTLRTGTTMPAASPEQNPLLNGNFEPLRRQILQAVLRAAEQRPETTPVQYSTEGLRFGRAGSYNPKTQAIQLTKMAIAGHPGGIYENLPPTSYPAQETLAHELLHFLGDVYRPELATAPRKAFPDMTLFRYLMQGVPGQEAAYDALGTTEGQHAIIRYLLGTDARPASLETYNKLQPLTQPPVVNEPARLMYNAFLRNIFPPGALQDKVLLK